MKVKRPTCRDCACATVCEHFWSKNTGNLNRTCPLPHWQDYFVPKRNWISVGERMPEDDFPKDTKRRKIRCLVATNKGSVKVCERQRYILANTGELSPWCWSRDMFATPTHWMPLPEPPKGD